jgi:hypothetical protein
MTARQIQKLNSYLSISLTCREHIAIVAMIPAMMRNVKEYDLLLSAILKYAEKQAVPITHHARQKLLLKIQIAKILSLFANIVRSYAMEGNKGVVLYDYKYTYSEFCRMKQTDFLFKCAYSIDFLKININCFRDYGMKKSSLDQLIQLYEQYDKIFSLPRVSKASRITSTSMLADEIEKIDHFLKHRVDTLLHSFTQYREFHKAFKAARKQIKYGRPKEILKNKIKKYRAAPALPRTRKSTKPVRQLKPLVMPENSMPDLIP